MVDFGGEAAKINQFIPLSCFQACDRALLTSIDGGVTWTYMVHQPNVDRIGPVVVDPRDSNSVYLFGGDRFNSSSGASDVGVFDTHDGGDTWVKMGGCDYPVWAMKFVRVGVDYWLYAATMNGLRYLKSIPSDPNTWWYSGEGMASVATIDAFNAGVEEGRVVYYIGTSGGSLPSPSAPREQLSAASAAQNFAGGIYRSMRRIELYYLPVIRR